MPKSRSSCKLQDLEKADNTANWKILLATDALHFQDSIQDDSEQPSGKARLQVLIFSLSHSHVSTVIRLSRFCFLCFKSFPVSTMGDINGNPHPKLIWEIFVRLFSDYYCINSLTRRNPHPLLLGSLLIP